MSLFNIVKNIVPETWTKGGTYTGQFIVSKNSDEFDEIEGFIDDHVTGTTADIDIVQVERVQNLYSYGRFVLRKEQLSTFEDSAYLVKKIAIINIDKLQTALKYNLDSRRLDNVEVELHDFVEYHTITSDKVLLIISVLCEDDDDLNSSTVYFNKNMYIEYIVHLS